jgi:hypothetical protein
MKRFVPGALAGFAAAIVLAAPAAATPSNVTVRVEGEAATLQPRTPVTTDSQPVLVEGARSCPGTSAGGALYKAVGGDLSGTWLSFGFDLKTIKGETHDSSTSSTYWSFWLNYSYASLGMCAQELQEGDDVLFVPDCFGAGCNPASPLRVSGLPATIAPGASVTVRVDEYSPPVSEGAPTTSKPSAGATVAFGGTTATTGSDGTAQLTFSGSGPTSVQATKPGHVRSSTESTCVTTGSDGACGSQVGSPPPAAVKDETAPTATIAGLRRGKVFSRKRAPRTLRGTVSADPSGIKSVRLSILRRHRGRCWAFDGESERFERHRCGGSKSFRIGDRAEWSYLLPKRLPRGRYTIRVIAIDKAGNDSVTQTEIRVR